MFTYTNGKVQKTDLTRSANNDRSMHTSYNSKDGKSVRLRRQWAANLNGNAENLKPFIDPRKGSALQLPTLNGNVNYNSRQENIKSRNISDVRTPYGFPNPPNFSETKVYRTREEPKGPSKFTIPKNGFDARLERAAAYPTNFPVYTSTTPRANHQKQQNRFQYDSVDRARPKIQSSTQMAKPQYPMPPKANEVAPAVPPKSTRLKPQQFAAVIKPMSNGRQDRSQAAPFLAQSRPSSPRSPSPPWHSLFHRSMYARNSSRELEAPQNGLSSAEQQRRSPHQPVHRRSTAAQLKDRTEPLTSNNNNALHPLRNGVSNGNEVMARIASRDDLRRFQDGGQRSNLHTQSSGVMWLPSSDQGTHRTSRNVNGDTSGPRYPPDLDHQPQSNGRRSRSISRPRPASENRQYDPPELPLQRQNQQNQVGSPKVAAKAPQPPPRPALPKKPVSRSTTESASSSHPRPSQPSVPTSARPLRHYLPVYSNHLKDDYEDEDEEDEEDGTLRLVAEIDQQAAPIYDSPHQAASERMVLHAHHVPTGSTANRAETVRPLRHSGINNHRSSIRNTPHTAARPMPDYENLEDLKVVFGRSAPARSRRPEAGLAHKSNNLLPPRTASRNGSGAVSRAGNYSVFPEASKNGHWTRKTVQEGASKLTHVPASRHNSSPSMSTRSLLEFRKILEREVTSGDPRPDLKELGVIGDGSTSVVFLARSRRSGRLLAVKKMSLTKQQRPELLLNEAIVMRAYAHPNIVEMYASYLVGDELWVLMEYMECGALTDIISHSKLNEEQIATICLPVLTALAYLHDHGVIHRDVKSDSVLLSARGIVKLSDFGFCAKVSAEGPRRRSLVGTPYWMAPEVIARTPYFTAADVWSFGVLIIEMVEGEPNLFDEPPSVAMERIKESYTPHLRFPQMSSPALNSFLSIILVRQDLHRATASQLLRHPFLKRAGPPSCLQPLLARVTPEWR
ncbi:hypothetical protein AAHC03_02051 [Spirometra sp. Aus1]